VRLLQAFFHLQPHEEIVMRQKPVLTADDCHKMMAACKAEAQKNKWAVTIAIVDDSGAALLLERLDGCGAIASTVAMGKAQTSALTKRPSKFFEDRIKERPGFVTFPTPGVMFQGGVPIVHQGECVGAIGVSGVQSHEDEAVAQAGVTALG
jgi:glc operon protein GlcG